MINNIKLQNIAKIYSGYTFRRAIQSVSNGVIFVLQAKDIIQNEPVLNPDELTKISLELPRSNSYILKNDILLISRATGPGNFRAALFESEEKNVIASSSLFIIRITDKNILPEYISLYLNSPEGQNALVQSLSGSYIKSLPRKNLEELQIPIPELQIQKSLIELNRNIRLQEKISERKRQLRKNIINQLFRNVICR